MIPEAFTLEEFMWFYNKKYRDFEDFHQNAYLRDRAKAVAIHPNKWKEEWGSPDYLVFDFDNDDFVKKPGFLCSDGDFDFMNLYHYQYYVEEFIYGIRKVNYNIIAIISYWEGMCKVFNDVLRSRDAGGVGLDDLLKDFEPLDIKNERNWELCRMALAGEKSEHKYPECDERLKFGECEVVKSRMKCLQLLDENRCPMSKIWKDRKTSG